MAKIDIEYHKLLSKIKKEGFRYEDPNRKGVHRLQIPDYTITHDFKDGFPAITTKELYWKGVVGELLWILRGDTNIKYLVKNKINIWNKDAYNYYVEQEKESENAKKRGLLSYSEFLRAIDKYPTLSLNEHTIGYLGSTYGYQLRRWNELSGEKITDQLVNLINTLKTNPMATKKTVTFWNPSEKDDCALTPCHWSFEILVEPLDQNQRIAYFNENYSKPLSEYAGGGYEVQSISHQIESRLNNANVPKYNFTLKWHQHSVDTFLGLPFNIASYALLAQIIGKMTNMVPKGIIGDLSNVHIYEPHLDAFKLQLSRDVYKYDKCELRVGSAATDLLQSGIDTDTIVDGIQILDFKLKDYKHYPAIGAEMLAYSK